MRPAVLAVFDPSPFPFIALMGLGFLIGAAGHVYGSKRPPRRGSA